MSRPPDASDSRVPVPESGRAVLREELGAFAESLSQELRHVEQRITRALIERDGELAERLLLDERRALDRMDARVDGWDGRWSLLEQRLDRLESRVWSVDRQVAAIRASLAGDDPAAGP